jgi:hypothetical protein
VVGEITDTLGGSITSAAERQALEPRHLRNGLHWDDGGHSIFCPHGAHYLICIKSDLVPWVWRACHCSAIFLIRTFLRPC